jgi:hypothetical protein
MGRLVVVAVVFLAGCMGEITSPGGGGSDPGPDAATGSNPATPDAPGAQFACRNRVTTNLSSGQHNPGQDCNGSCHNHGFTLAGTLTGPGGTAYTGGTITIIDANNATIDVVTARNGNFYTKAPIAFPAAVVASSCPDVMPMVTHITKATAGCNMTGCHVTGAQGAIHLP